MFVEESSSFVGFVRSLIVWTEVSTTGDGLADLGDSDLNTLPGLERSLKLARDFNESLKKLDDFGVISIVFKEASDVVNAVELFVGSSGPYPLIELLVDNLGLINFALLRRCDGGGRLGSFDTILPSPLKLLSPELVVVD